MADQQEPGVDQTATDATDTGEIRPIAPRLESLVVQPWPVHRARTARRWLVALVILAPALATAAAWWGLADQAEKEVVGYQGVEEDAWLDVEATALTLAPDLGEMSMRMVFFPRGELIDRDRLTSDVTLVLNDEAGRNVRTFNSGSVMESTTIVVALKGNPTRYPFDLYSGDLLVGATMDEDGNNQPLTVDLEVNSALSEFAMAAVPEAGDNSVLVDLDMGRRWASIVWVVMFMVIAWSIAISCAAVTWWVVVFNAATPMWVYPLFAAVLFALPSLRIGLPGNPRYGVLVDWAAFYWAITIVAFGLVAVLTVWNVSARSSFRQALRRTQAEHADRR